VRPIVGTDVVDLARAQGRAVATDRLWEITLDAWRARGTVAAALGPDALPWDVFARRAMLADVAQRAYRNLDAETRAFVDAFVAGINEAIPAARADELDRLGVVPDLWEPWMPLAVLHVNHVLFSTFPTKLWRRHARHAVGAEVLALFAAEPPAVPGSNAFAVGPERTASGSPLIAGDPHRLFEAPGGYQQVHLVCPGVDVAGFTFPGVPGVQHFAHAGEVAWGITHAMADYQDLVDHDLAVEPPVRSWTEAIEVRDGDPFPVDVVLTADGPLVADRCALRTPAHVLGDLGFGALLPLLRARRVEDVLVAFEHWVEPVNNLVVADATGRVARQVVGRVPDRDRSARQEPVRAGTARWTGWVELPGAEVPTDQVVVTANQRMAGFEVLGDDFAAPYRADRITELLGDRQDLKADDVRRILRDTRRPPTVLTRLLATAAAARLSAPAADLLDRLQAWSGDIEPDSAEASAYLAVRDHLVEALVALPVFRALDAPSPYGALFDPWFVLAPRVLHALDRLLGAGELLGHRPDDLLAEALEHVAAATPQPRILHAGHALGAFGPPTPAPAVPGDLDCVCSMSGPPGGPVVRGPVARYVWDLADRANGGWVVPFGTGQLDAWLDGRLLPLPPYPSKET